MGLTTALAGAHAAIDGRTLVKDAPPAFQAGDVVVSINGAALNEASRTGLIDVLEHLAPDADVSVGVQRAGVAQTVTTRCSDVKPFYDTLRAAADAAVADDGRGCAAHLAAAAALHALSATWARLQMSCRIDAGQLRGSAVWQADYELYHQLIDEARPAPARLAALRHPVLESARDLDLSGNPRLAAELRQHYAAATARLRLADD